MKKEDDEKAAEIEAYLALHAFAFQRNGYVYYLIDRRDGVATPVGSEDRGGRPEALKAARAFVEAALAERASVAARSAEYLTRVKK
jgi:hypothetical protein